MDDGPFTTPGERFESPPHPPRSHARLRRLLEYRFAPRGRRWHGIDVLVGTHQQSARGRLELTVLSPNGRVMRVAHADLATARDNDWLRFDFAPIVNSAGCPFRLRFALTTLGPRPRLSLYEATPDARRLSRRVGRYLGLAAAGDSLYCRPRYAR
jgi:hypothetical protein